MAAEIRRMYSGNSTVESCSVAGCPAGPWCASGRVVLAEAREIPSDCPNSMCQTDPAGQLHRRLPNLCEMYVTRRAAEVLSLRPHGGTPCELLALLSARELALLEPRAASRLPAGAASALAQEKASETPLGPERREVQESWVEIEMVDESGQPWPDEPYEVFLPDSAVRTGRLNHSGKARVSLPKAVEVQIGFPRLDSDAWEKSA